MFGLLKNKFKELTSKIFGKSQEKEEQPVVEKSLQEPISNEEKTIQPPAQELSKTNVATTSQIPEVNVQKERFTENIRQSVPTSQPVATKEEVFDDFDEQLEKELEQYKYKEPLVQKVSEPQKPKVASESVIQTPVPKPIKKILIEPKETEPKTYSKQESFQIKKEVEKEIEKVSEEIKKDEIENISIQEPVNSERYEELKTKKPEKVKTSVFTSIKSIFVSKVSLSEKEINDFLDDFEISLLEADVSLDASQAIVNDLKTKLSSAKFSKSNLLEDIKKEIRESLFIQLNIDCNMDNYINKSKDEPLIIMFVGPNGAGKTTTIARFAYMYKQLNRSVILASSDTFRAGAIDQLEIHSQRLGVRVVKQNYNSDPAAVAFDAVTSAKANKVDVVLIDTAGRQETNINLMQELQKIKRVVKPHLTIYVGESQAGQAIVDQIKNFDKDIGLSGVVLTKIDTDPKGGVAISILNELKKPIFYLGTGQEYNNLEKFSPEYIIERIV